MPRKWDDGRRKLLHLGKFRPYQQILDQSEKRDTDKHSSLFSEI